MSASQMSDPEAMLPGEVARLFRVDPKTVTRWVKDDKLPCWFKTPGGHARFRRSEVMELINGQG